MIADQLEQKLKEQLREIEQRAKREAAPIIARLIELERLKPPATAECYTCIVCGVIAPTDFSHMCKD